MPRRVEGIKMGLITGSDRSEGNLEGTKSRKRRKVLEKGEVSREPVERDLKFPI